MLIASLIVLTCTSLWFRHSLWLRAIVIVLLLLVTSSQVWMLSHVGRTVYPVERPSHAQLGDHEEFVDPRGLVPDTFDNGAFVALKKADEFIRRRAAEVWGFAICLGLLAMRPLERRQPRAG